MNYNTLKLLFVGLVFATSVAHANSELKQSKSLRELKDKLEAVASFVEDNEYDTFDVRLLDIRRFTEYAQYPDFADATRENFLVFVKGDYSTEFSYLLERGVRTNKEKTNLRNLIMPEKNIYYGDTEQKEFDQAYKTALDSLNKYMNAHAKDLIYVDAGGASNTGDCRFGYLSEEDSYDILYVSHCHAND